MEASDTTAAEKAASGIAATGVEAATRFRLRPGYVAVRRDKTHVQVGLDPPQRVVLPDTPDVRRLLTDLVAGSALAPTTVPARRALADLVAARLVDDGAPPPALPVAVEGPAPLAATFRGLLGPLARAEPALVVLLCAGPLSRERVDPLLRAGTPHLVVEGGADAWTVGPLVIPGVTACLRCVDATLGEADPRRALVLEQTARVARPPVDQLLSALALSSAARDARAHLAGGRPATWSATITLTREGQPAERRWRRHPHCGCAWDLIAVGG